jgi:hypothetical protein
MNTDTTGTANTGTTIEDMIKAMSSLSKLKAGLAPLEIRENKHLIKFVKRDWKERLFTLPWRPLKRCKEVPSEECFIMEKPAFGMTALFGMGDPMQSSGKIVVMHPHYAKKLREATELEQEAHFKKWG